MLPICTEHHMTMTLASLLLDTHENFQGWLRTGLLASRQCSHQQHAARQPSRGALLVQAAAAGFFDSGPARAPAAPPLQAPQVVTEVLAPPQIYQKVSYTCLHSI